METLDVVCEAHIKPCIDYERCRFRCPRRIVCSNCQKAYVFCMMSVGKSRDELDIKAKKYGTSWSVPLASASRQQARIRIIDKR